MGSRRMLLDGIALEAEYVGDREDGDYGTVYVSVRGASDERPGEELTCYSFLIEELPNVISLLQLMIDEYFAQRKSTRPMRDASWIR
jgi:hypothetical protein